MIDCGEVKEDLGVLDRRRGLRWFGAAGLVLFLLSGLSPLLAAADGDGIADPGVERWIHLFENPQRAIWQKPAAVVEALRLSKGDRIADIGAGSGYFTRRFSAAVGESGTVWAVDIEPKMLRYVQMTAQRQGLRNIVTILAAADDPHLPTGMSDVLFICNTVRDIPDREAYLSGLERYLAPGGRIVLIDYFKEKLPVGPPSALKLRRIDLLHEIQQSGYELLEEHRFLPYQYFLVIGRSRGPRPTTQPWTQRPASQPAEPTPSP